ncbi:hypothetical protein DNTS_006284 [Danionella cerebrum]|uniref:LITAF domain-containing protein n=1 Tax=Danionella cerebrum TaxID=2873325 RepID=A0A553Q205_9TELE|nr:hypothetical protein DNTS_006284 [Danionella translucida]
MNPNLTQGSKQDEDTTNIWNILFRRQQLQNRLQFLQEIQKKNNKIEVSATDPIQAPIQGLYVLPISQTEAINPTISLPQDKTEDFSPVSAQPEENKEILVSIDDLSTSPAKVECPSCNKTVTTEMRYKLSSNAFLFCCLLSVVGCLAGCCLIPFFMNRFKDVSHRCPSCHKDICTVNRI